MSFIDASQINLASLQKVDPTITSIVGSANHVALYTYLHVEQDWEMTDIEGSLFIFNRTIKPHHGLFIMNRKSTQNFVFLITDTFYSHQQDKFLLFRNGKAPIYSLWFYEKKNIGKIHKLLVSLAEAAGSKNERQTSTKRQRSYSETNNNKQDTDIISMLSKAQVEYDKSHQPTATTAPSFNGTVVKPTPIHAYNGRVATSDSSTQISLDALFGRTTKNNNIKSEDDDSVPPMTRLRSHTTTGAPASESAIQNLLSNAAHTLEHIEAAQKREEKHMLSQLKEEETRKLKMPSIEIMEKDLKEKLNIFPKSSVDVIQSDPIDIPILTPAMLESSTSMLGTSLPVAETLSFSPSQLLSPMDFALPSRKSIISVSPDNGHIAKGSNENLLPPHSLLNKPAQVTPLNKDQFKEALLYMIQNDDEFVMQLHDCYVKSLKSHLNTTKTS